MYLAVTVAELRRKTVFVIIKIGYKPFIILEIQFRGNFLDVFISVRKECFRLVEKKTVYQHLRVYTKVALAYS